ncbi:hypothetical protein A2704_01335 [Candidatus Kaiserbacteria bacterium RIFCSPHIGHO2_01_FULL_54_36b]|uniref:Uncharacterized protein n=1 Tax=Candidatus Kaiserbacteria bacterium RIFCSPHIGHO2_01_FULL_54_36b TaxID=1798483 RepID=A0A1F6CPR2_9BACT|nr:MAG: hypothetical protein A2704_01335 [Candidatus Kaiserbacteria bacterium RIFCSPHIGHO2_01_FULL_54_36b]
MNARIQFFAHDRTLRQLICADLTPHFPEQAKPVPVSGDLVISCAQLLVVGISAIPADTFMSAIEASNARKIPCGILVRTADPRTWRKLSEVHARTPFLFVAAMYGPRKEIPKLFPGARVFTDGGELELSGQNIARLIWEVAQRKTISA